MNQRDLKSGFVELLGEIRALGPAPSENDIERAFDRSFPALLRAADPYAADELGDDARERILAAVAAAGIVPAVRPGALRRPWLLALAAGLLAALGLWLGGVFTREPREEVASVPPPEAAVFSAVTGAPAVRAPGAADPATAELGLAVVYGARVGTGDADQAELRFADGTTLRLGFNTAIELPPAPAPGQPLPPRPHDVRVTSGRVLARVTHLEDEEHFLIETPVATAEVLGTEFALGLERDDGGAPLRAVLEVRSGRVAFYNGLGRVLATDLMSTSATADGAPSEPQRIRAFRSFHYNERSSLSGVTAPLSVADACQWTSPPPGLASLYFRDTDDGRVVLQRVLGGSNAAQAGLRASDEVRAIGGEPVSDAWAATLAVLRRPESSVTIQAARDGNPFEVTFLFRAWSPGDIDDGLRLEQQLGGSALSELPRDRTPARSALEALIARDPHPAYWNNLGLFWQVDDQMGPALRCFAEAVRLAPERALFRLNLARALQAIGNLERAAEELRAAVRHAPQWTTPHLAQVDVLLLLDRAEQALAATTGLEPSFPEDTANILSRRAKALIVLGRLAEARNALEAALVVEPESATLLLYLAMALVAQGDLESAIPLLERAVELDPSSAVAANNLGQAYLDSGRLAEAEPILRRAIELEPTDPTAYMNLGIVLQQLGRPDEAEPLYQRAVEVNPEYPDTYNNYGHLLWQTGRTDEGERMLRKCLELDPRSGLACANLGSLLAENNRRSEAAELYREFLRVSPGVGIILNNLAFVLAEMGTDLDEALEAANAAVAAAPQRPTRHHTLGTVRAARGELEPAAAAFERALGLYGDVEDAGSCWEELGVVRERRGDSPGAREAYRKAVQLDPTREQARSALQRLGG